MMSNRRQALVDTIAQLEERHETKIKRIQELKELALSKQQQKLESAKSKTPATMHLEILAEEEKRMASEISRLNRERELYSKALPEVVRLQVRAMVRESVRQYQRSMPLLRAEISETQGELLTERQTLSESIEIRSALQERLSHLTQFMASGSSIEINQERQRLSEMRRTVQILMRELTGFLEEHCTVVESEDPGDFDEETGERRTFALKAVLEDIMNLSVSQPLDPYLVLVPGEYHPPHVEQLINAGIAVRDPRDSQRLRLVEFYT